MGIMYAQCTFPIVGWSAMSILDGTEPMPRLDHFKLWTFCLRGMVLVHDLNRKWHTRMPEEWNKIPPYSPEEINYVTWMHPLKRKIPYRVMKENVVGKPFAEIQ